MVLALAQGAAPRQALAWGVAAGGAAIAAHGTARVQRQEFERRCARFAAAPEPSAVTV